MNSTHLFDVLILTVVVVGGLVTYGFRAAWLRRR
jgi:hypothetical protein